MYLLDEIVSLSKFPVMTGRMRWCDASIIAIGFHVGID
jgi:hypothetical protein